MVKKKKEKERIPNSLAETVGFSNIFQNDKVRFITGLIFFLIAIYLIIAFGSFILTGGGDQSLVEDPQISNLRSSTPGTG